MTFGVFGVDQVWFKGAYFETFYRKVCPEYQKKVIFHEAGHFLMAYLLGNPIRACVTTPLGIRKTFKRHGVSGTISTDTQFADDVKKNKVTQQSLNRISVVIMGGMAAEAVMSNMYEGNSADENNITSILSLFRPLWGNVRTT